jgi:ubiquitin C-terminal hydrolase
MWNKVCAFGYVNPSHFKKIFGEHNIMFQGYEQHDSQEFLSQLLD